MYLVINLRIVIKFMYRNFKVNTKVLTFRFVRESNVEIGATS